MSPIKPPVTFAQALKAPVTYAMMIVVSLMWTFVYFYRDSNNDRNTQCQNENTQLRQENRELKEDNKQERKRADQLTTALLVKNGIIYELKYSKTTDSLEQAQDSTK